MVDERDFREERQELETIMSSGLFARSINLAQLLQYVCERTFEGASERIKEYNVAVEALGRPPEFDQKRDSIVRVEAHRLRKKLQEYYAGDGASHAIKIQLPPGNYVPQFVRTEQPMDLVPVRPAILPPAPDNSRSTSKWVGILAITTVVGIAGIALALYRTESTAAGRLASRTDIPAAPLPGPEVRIVSGSDSPRYVDHLGNVWGPDRFFDGGTVVASPLRAIARSSDPALYLGRREGDFSYDIPLKPGTYELRLHFAETVFGEGNIAGGGESSRVFNVSANGSPLFVAWDTLADAGGGNVADIKVYKDMHPAADGFLHLRFGPTLKEKPFVNAIEVVPGTPGRMLPVRIIARDSPFRDWLADRYYSGGQLVQRHEPVEASDQSELFQNERFGNFSYAIPVAADSHYTVTLYFCESWFGPARTGGGGAGSRIFDVYLNGIALMRNFDLYAEAGGPLRGITRTFRHLTPNAQGKLMLQFAPVQNYALVNAIEVVDEGR